MFTRARYATICAIGAAALSLATSHGLAESYPSRQINLLVPFPPGGNSEVVIRALAERASSALGQVIVIDHRAGAGGTLAAKAVASAAADGHTLMFTTPGPLVTADVLFRNIGYDPAKSLVAVALVLQIPQMLAVHPSVPANTMHELTAYAKRNPGKLNFVSPGIGTQPHLLGELYKRVAGIDIVHVPYKGAGQALTDLLGGQVQMYFQSISLLLPHIQAGKLKAIAVADDRRSSELPNVPTMNESGFPALRATFWNGIVAPAGTPKTVISRLNATVNAVLRAADLQANLAKLSARAVAWSPDEFAAFIAAERTKWSAIVRDAQIVAH